MQKTKLNFKSLFIISLLIIVNSMTLLSCKKDAGPGGTSTITGKVWVQNYNPDFTFITSEYWAEEEDVYIMYGSDSIYSDRFKTHYDGSYRFQYLREGEYTIYAYSKDNAQPPLSESYNKPISVKVTISDGGQVVSAPVITIFD